MSNQFDILEIKVYAGHGTVELSVGAGLHEPTHVKHINIATARALAAAIFDAALRSEAIATLPEDIQAERLQAEKKKSG